MVNVVDAMKLLGLKGRIQFEWVSAKPGDPSSRRHSPGFVEQIRALDPSPLRNAAEWAQKTIGIAGGGRGGVAVRFLFFRGGCPSVYRGYVFVGLRRLVETSRTPRFSWVL